MPHTLSTSLLSDRSHGPIRLSSKCTSSPCTCHFTFIQSDMTIDQDKPRNWSANPSHLSVETGILNVEFGIWNKEGGRWKRGVGCWATGSTYLIPSARRFGSSKVARSLIVLGSKSTKSAAEPIPIYPLCGNTPRRFAGREVTCETISSRGRRERSLA